MTTSPLTKTNALERLFCKSISPPPEDPGCCEIAGDKVTVDLARAGVLSTPGGALRLDDDRLPDRILLVHAKDGAFHAYRNRCACGGFRVDPVPGEEKIRCCTPMQSTYDLAGRRISGSAQKDLDVLAVEAGDGKVVVDLSSIHDLPPPHARKEKT